MTLYLVTVPEPNRIPPPYALPDHPDSIMLDGLTLATMMAAGTVEQVDGPAYLMTQPGWLQYLADIGYPQLHGPKRPE